MKLSAGVVAMAAAATVTTEVRALPSYQSGPNAGAVYAASLARDDETNVLYITGITYDPSIDDSIDSSGPTPTSNCFVMELDYDVSQTVLDSTSTAVFGTDDTVVDTCRDSALLSAQQLVVVGNADPGGLYADNTDAVQVGFGMALSRQDLSVVTGSSLFSSQVPYPQAIVVDPNDPDSFYIASMTSNEDQENTPENTEYPNWTHQFQHGTAFEMTVERLQYTTEGTGNTFNGILDGMGSTENSRPVLRRVWSKSYPLDRAPGGESEPTAYVGGMIWKQDVGLIVAGSTAGLGIGYGPAEGDDEDGFISIFDPLSGELVVDRKNNQRFGTADYDVVTSICDAPNEPNAFYIVGATRGDINGILEDDAPTAEGSLYAFIKKVDLDSLHGDWTVQHGAQLGDSITATTALGCAAFGDVVYVTGVVSDGAGMIDGSQVHTSSGGDDIWVAQYNAADGTVNWMKQIGSDGDDHVARNGAIQVDAQGNAIIVGDTTGAMYRDRQVSSSTDVFVITLDIVSGDYEPTIQGDSPDDTPEDSSIPLTEEELAPELGDVDPEELPTEATVPSSAQVHQSGPNAGAMYASSIAYDAATDQAIIIGISYTSGTGTVMVEPSCLIARIEIGSMETKEYTIPGTSDGVLESCRDVALTEASSLLDATVIVVGNSEAGGLYADDSAVQGGFAMSLNGDSLDILEGTSLFSNSIPYPQAVVVDGIDIYVASMNSNDLTQNANDQVRSDFPNWTYLNKYGKGFTMTIEKLSLPNFDSVWSQNYPVRPESDETENSVHVGGMILKDGKLIVVGSTRAKGDAYGAAEGFDADGYISVLDPNTGSLMPSVKNNVRIGSEADDVVSEICDVPGDSNSIIVVGATMGDVGGIRDTQANVAAGSMQWFAKKINLETLNEAWSIQGGAVYSGEKATLRSSIFAIGCHVHDSAVYIGGTVEDGAQLVANGSPVDSLGSDDVWVAKLDINDGSVTWIRQLGSVGRDQLARNGGISTNKDGNILIYGDTTGAILRSRAVGSNADLFLAVLNSMTGEYEIKGTPAPGSGPAADVPVSQPTPPPVAPPTQNEDFNDEGEEIPDEIVAIQFGPDVGPSYAGGMDYDSETNSLYLTGATFGAFSGPGIRAEKQSDCFFARIDLPELEVIQREKYGVSMEPDACTAIAANDFNGDRNVIAIGSTEAGGLLTELTDASSLQYGFAMDLSFQHKFEFLGGSVVGSGPVTFPVDVVADQDYFWTVSMTSTEKKVTADSDKVTDKKFPNLTNGGAQKYGEAYAITLEAFKVMRVGQGNPFAQGSDQSFESEWTHVLSFGNQEYRGKMVHAMIHVSNYLVVVGAVENNGNMDGFMAKVSSESGRLALGTGQAMKFYSASKKSDDWIMNACTDPDSGGHFYVVGASHGKDASSDKDGETIHAFVAKISTITLESVWEKEFKVMHPNAKKNGVYAAGAYGCALVPVENILYVGGTVENGAVMADLESGEQSAGGDDIFVASLSMLDGEVNWMKQTGSNGDDRVARSGGVRADNNGNLVVYGDTTGDFFRMRSGDDATQRYSDAFVMLFDKRNGIHQSPLKGPKLSESSTPTEFFNDFTKDKKKGARIFGVVVLVLVILGLLWFGYRRCCRRSMKEPPSIYDAAAAAELDFDEPTVSSSGGRGLGFGLFSSSSRRNSYRDQSNLNYRDDQDGNGGLVGNLHKTYSDLPQKGKQII